MYRVKPCLHPIEYVLRFATYLHPSAKLFVRHPSCAIQQNIEHPDPWPGMTDKNESMFLLVMTSTYLPSGDSLTRIVVS